MVSYNNLDSFAEFKKLQSLKGHFSLAGNLNEERVAKCSSKMAAGLTYNYAAKEVDDSILSVLQKLADRKSTRLNSSH